jgi:hypothetical protein
MVGMPVDELRQHDAARLGIADVQLGRRDAVVKLLQRGDSGGGVSVVRGQMDEPLIRPCSHVIRHLDVGLRLGVGASDLPLQPARFSPPAQPRCRDRATPSSHGRRDHRDGRARAPCPAGASGNSGYLEAVSPTWLLTARKTGTPLQLIAVEEPHPISVRVEP